MSYYLSIKNDRIEISRDQGADARVVTSVASYYEYIESEAKRSGCAPEDIPVYASSSMDFPDEFTSNPETIALAKALKETA